MGKGACELEVRIGDRSGRIGEGDQLRLNMARERGAPEIWLDTARASSIRDKKHAAHSCGGGIRGTKNSGFCWYDFSQTCGACGEVSSQLAYVIKKIMQGGAEANSGLRCVAKGFLEQTEHASETGDS
jgi:hypothetical protein